MPYTEEQLTKLRGYYKSLIGQRELWAELVRRSELLILSWSARHGAGFLRYGARLFDVGGYIARLVPVYVNHVQWLAERSLNGTKPKVDGIFASAALISNL
jgi:hypothetical protein